MKFYDFAKAKEIAMKFIGKKEVISISIGMSSEWFLTSEVIWNRVKGYRLDLDTVEFIGGINGSFWDTPALRVYFEDGHVEEWEVWKQCDPEEKERLCKHQNEMVRQLIEEMS